VCVLPIMLIGIVQVAGSGAVAVAQFLAVLRLVTYPFLVTINLKGSGMNAAMYVYSNLKLLGGAATLVALSFLVRYFLENVLVENISLFLFSLFWSGVLYVAFYFFYRSVPVGCEVLIWAYQKIGGRLKLPKFICPENI